MTYNLRVLDRSDGPALTRLLDEVFHIKIREKEKLVAWKYFHPFVRGIVQYGAFDGDTLVAHYANIPVMLSHDMTMIPAMMCIDMATHPEYRGRGLISLLSQKVYQEIGKSPVISSIGFSNDEGVHVDKFAKGYGYRVVGRFQSYGFMAVTGKRTPVRLEPMTDFTDGMTYVLPDHMYSIAKTEQYLRWRYIDNPSDSYHIYSVIVQDRVTGYVVLKYDRMRMYIVDLSLSDMDGQNVIHAIDAVADLSRKSGKQIVALSVLDTAYWRDIFRGHFVIRKLPHDSYYLTVRLHKPNAEYEAMYDPERWICMSGDIL